MAQIELNAKHNPMALLFYLTKLRVLVDGQPQPGLGWGRHTVEVPPGQHQVDISFNYLGQGRGPASTTVNAVEGQTVHVRYRMPSFMFAKGRIKVG